MNLPLLELSNLADRHIGLTQALAESYLEAARVSLDRHHNPPQEFILRNESIAQTVLVNWIPSDKRSRGAWANEDDATRDGAYACAIAATELSLGLYSVRRAETLTGADYYVSTINQIPEDLEACFRLEVSGTSLDKYEVQRRLKNKLSQLLKGNCNLPALAVVVGFRVKLISMKTVGNLI